MRSTRPRRRRPWPRTRRRPAPPSCRTPTSWTRRRSSRSRSARSRRPTRRPRRASSSRCSTTCADVSPSAATARAATPPFQAAGRRTAAAVLRWRARALLAGPATGRSCAALPMLLQASFDAPPLDRDAPGLAGARYRRHWLALARALHLPAPRRLHRGAPLVLALVAIPTHRGLDAVALVAQGTDARDLALLRERCAAAERALRAGGAEVHLAIADAPDLAEDGATARRLVAFGALLAGEIPTDVW